MGQRTSPFCFAAVCLAVIVASPAARADLVPPEQLDQLVADQDFKTARSALLRVLALGRTSKAAAGYDFVHVWTLMATNELNRGNGPAAAAAAKQGVAEAEAAGQVEAADELMAMSRLIEAAHNGDTYTARSGADRGKQYKVSDPAERKAAYPALFADELLAVENDRVRAKAGRSLNTLIAAAETFKAIRSLDRVAHGNTAATDPVSMAAAKECRALIDQWLKQKAEDLTKAAADAKVVVHQGRAAQVQGHVQQGAVARRVRGLTADQRRVAKDVVSTTAALDAVVDKLVRGFARPGVFAGVHTAADNLNRQATALLDKYPG